MRHCFFHILWNGEHLPISFDLLVGQSAEIAFAIGPRNENRAGINRTEKPSVSLHAAQLGFLVSENHAVVIKGIGVFYECFFSVVADGTLK